MKWDNKDLLRAVTHNAGISTGYIFRPLVYVRDSSSFLYCPIIASRRLQCVFVA